MRTQFKTLRRTLSMLALTFAGFVSAGAAPAHALTEDFVFLDSAPGYGSQDLILNGGAYVIQANTTGFVDQYTINGHTGTSGGGFSYLAGYFNGGYTDTYRDFFGFDLSSVRTPITSATLSLYNPGFAGNLNTFSLHDITALLPLTGGLPLFNGIGTAPVIGSTYVGSTSGGTNVNVNLNPYELAVMNSLRARPHSVGIGQAQVTIAIGGTLSAVPLPAGLPMFTLALLGMFAAVQFRNQRKLA
jgi:hypothetical protein